MLAGGLSLKREGADVELTPAFRAHLDAIWLPFAADVLDSIIKFGVTPIVYEQLEEVAPVIRPIAKKQRAAVKGGGGHGGVANDIKFPKLRTHSANISFLVSSHFISSAAAQATSS